MKTTRKSFFREPTEQTSEITRSSFFNSILMNYNSIFYPFFFITREYEKVRQKVLYIKFLRILSIIIIW